MTSREERAWKRKKIRSIIRETSHLPTLPTMMLELEQILDEREPSKATIAHIIQKDVATAGNLLRIVNSNPLYTIAAGETWNIVEAVRRVGVDEIRRLASAISLVTLFPDSLVHIDYTGFWRHSLGVAGAARLLAVICYQHVHVEPDEAYTAGLMHDIGWLLLDQYLPEFTEQIVLISKARSVPRIEAEREVLGADHGEVGGMLLERWRLPADIIEGVSWHHDPDFASIRGRDLAAIVHVSDHVCRPPDDADPEAPIDPRRAADYLWKLGVPHDEHPKVMGDILEVARKMADIIHHLPGGRAPGPPAAAETASGIHDSGYFKAAAAAADNRKGRRR